MIPGANVDDGDPHRDEQWRIFDIRLKYFQAVGKHQAFYTNSLCLMLAVVWTWKLLSGGQGVTIQILGATISITGFWPAVPFVATVLLLGFLGSINYTFHAWRRLDMQVSEMGLAQRIGFFAELDPNKTFIDYLGGLSISHHRPILPDHPEPNEFAWRDRMIQLLCPSVVVATVATTIFTVVEIGWSTVHVVYVFTSAMVQVAFSLPMLRRKLWTFLGIYKNDYDALNQNFTG
jgi:hypothetical protein